MGFLKTDPSMRGLSNRALLAYMGVMPAPTKPVGGRDAAIYQGLNLVDSMWQNDQARIKELEDNNDFARAQDLRKKSGSDLLNRIMQLTGANPLQQAIADTMDEAK